ncbi:iron-sulfur cluster assembly accessory protein [Niveomyces insectorum RCEF 264]|uniref:Iron-sulfur cluster assembly accessory protein n=1 Tax=Niveomyces insectorum RCEF 264 TaxID=1081102 RepID=A0A167UU46_9HYPO|nr:iron-sulfur cluster assembly accessory protein [Niveomyces insectorum RCEF 264]
MASVARCSRSAATSSAAVKRHVRCAGPMALRVSVHAPVLDFLLPSLLPRTYERVVSTTSGQGAARAAKILSGPGPEPEPGRMQMRAQAHKQRHPSELPRNDLFAWTTNSVLQKRLFSTTQRRAKTRTILNPQTNEDGNEMVLEITSRAAKRLAKVMEKDGNPRLALRIAVESGGCHGFQYIMRLVTLPEKLPEPNPAATAPDAYGAEAESDGDSGAAIRADDTIFAYVAEEGEDVAGGPAGATDPLSAPKIILDTPSLELLNGSKVDFSMELIGSQFKIVDNPAATSSCGCGTSFDIKI